MLCYLINDILIIQLEFFVMDLVNSCVWSVQQY